MLGGKGQREAIVGERHGGRGSAPGESEEGEGGVAIWRCGRWEGGSGGMRGIRAKAAKYWVSIIYLYLIIIYIYLLFIILY